ncbi:heavy metal-associated isoprenylated plant protein 7 isoform X2 [Triticum aestivum]|uniref:heavy metal-associated isoprenylated plant protein 7 isoform X2 n=1 Tax=Triticum aestivum TaxID=4565 RepID=UPI001D01FD2A|nr:heavy metal-associated isoprenylated plant protein 7-like isoform X2 [Triticum aestivum]
MGEEEEKPKEEEPKKEEKPKEGEEDKPKDDKPKEGEGEGEKPKEEEAAPPPPPPPPEEVVMRVYMHCEGCARKVKKILKRFDGVEDVIADSKAHKVVVKGKKAAADPMKVVERVQKKTGRKVELLSPLPPPPEEKKEEEKKEEPEPPKPEEKKEPTVISVVLKVHMHCEACAQAIKKRIEKMKGVQSADPDLKASEVTVKGVFEEVKLAEYVHKRTGRHAAIIKSEPVAPAEKAGEGDAKDEKKAAEGGEEKKDDKEEKKDDKDGAADEKKEEKDKEDGGAGGEEKEKEKDPGAIAAANLYMHYPQFAFPGGYYPPRLGYAAYPPPPAYPPYPPQIFSDENPNACSVM